jgi:hypothetical protein
MAQEAHCNAQTLSEAPRVPEGGIYPD